MAAGRNKSEEQGDPSQPIAFIQDPTNRDLSPDEREDLARLLLAEEEKHGKKGVEKIKEWSAVNHEISRSSKRYRAVVVLGPDQDMPSSVIRKQEKERTGKSVIYLKKYPDGHIEACAGVKKQPKQVTLTPEQLKILHHLDRPYTIENDLDDECSLAEAFKRLNRARKSQDTVRIQASHNEIDRLTRAIKKKRKFISGIHEACGYTRYRYRITSTSNQSAEQGAFSQVNRSPGKLVLVSDEDGKIRAQYRESKHERITKFVPIVSDVLLADTLNEMALLKLPVMKAMLGSKDEATLQKDQFGKIKSIRITEDRAPGFELAVLLNESMCEHRGIQSLSDEERYQLVPLLLEALSAVHAKAIGNGMTGIVHRDISPRNMMVHRDPTANPPLSVKIIDPGLARRTRIKDETGRYRGTPFTMAPEMWARGEGNPEGDDYSLGVLLRILLSDGALYDRVGGVSRLEWDGRELYRVGCAEYHLGISRPKSRCAVLTRLKDRGFLTEDEVKTTEQIVNGMSQTVRGERWSAEKALALYNGQAFPEENTRQVPLHNIRLGITALEELKDYVDSKGHERKQRDKKESLLMVALDELEEVNSAFAKKCRFLCMPTGEISNKISNKILPTIIGLVSLALHEEKYVNQNNPDAEKNRAAILSQLQKAIDHGYKIRKPKIPYRDYANTAQFLIDRTVRTQPTGIGKIPRGVALVALYPVWAVTAFVSWVMTCIVTFFVNCVSKAEPSGCDPVRERASSVSVFCSHSSTAGFSKRLKMDLHCVPENPSVNHIVDPTRKNSGLSGRHIGPQPYVPSTLTRSMR